LTDATTTVAADLPLVGQPQRASEFRPSSTMGRFLHCNRLSASSPMPGCRRWRCICSRTPLFGSAPAV